MLYARGLCPLRIHYVLLGYPGPILQHLTLHPLVGKILVMGLGRRVGYIEEIGERRIREEKEKIIEGVEKKGEEKEKRREEKEKRRGIIRREQKE